MSRIGIFGGSFNPAHAAHLILAECARQEAALDRVLFVPARRPPHKCRVRLAPARHRLAMLRLALAGNPRFEVSTVELDRRGPSYTLDTVRQIKARLGARHELLLIVGADSIRDMPHWWRADELVREVKIIGLARPGYSLDDMGELKDAFGAQKVAEIRAGVVRAPLLEISATDIRDRVRRGRTIRYLVPEPVRRYIERHRLYGYHKRTK
jgi:nicotinate-nucleotide adenylyltransferase